MQSDSEHSVTAAMVAAMSSVCPNNGDASQTQMRAYMDKLRELVPQCPKNRNVSKLELIQHVIDYINDLQDTLQGGSNGDSPPPSPRLDALSFTEAFSHLGFGDSSHLCESKMHPLEEAAASYGARSYTSDGSSDYDSRGSSPVNHSDTDGSCDDFSASSFNRAMAPQPNNILMKSFQMPYYPGPEVNPNRGFPGFYNPNQSS